MSCIPCKCQLCDLLSSARGRLYICSFNPGKKKLELIICQCSNSLRVNIRIIAFKFGCTDMLYSYLWNSFCHCASLIAFHGITCLLTTVQRKKNKKPTQVPCFNEPNYDTIRIHMLQNISSVNSSMIGFVATVRSCKQATWCLIDIIQSVHLTDREDMLYIFSSLLVHNFLPSFVGKNFFQ